MTRDEYLRRVRRNPYELSMADGEVPPPEWVAAAWEIRRVRETHESEMARTVSKVGDLFVTPEFLELLSRSLNTEQVIHLYEAIRDESPHRESEFRPGFLEGFSRHASALPPPLTEQEVIAALGPEIAAAFGMIEPDPDAPPPEPVNDIPF